MIAVIPCRKHIWKLRTFDDHRKHRRSSKVALAWGIISPNELVRESESYVYSIWKYKEKFCWTEYYVQCINKTHKILRGRYMIGRDDRE